MSYGIVFCCDCKERIEYNIRDAVSLINEINQAGVHIENL